MSWWKRDENTTTEILVRLQVDLAKLSVRITEQDVQINGLRDELRAFKGRVYESHRKTVDQKSDTPESEQPAKEKEILSLTPRYL